MTEVVTTGAEVIATGAQYASKQGLLDRILFMWE